MPCPSWIFSDSTTAMIPSQAQSPPQLRLSAMALNSSPSAQLAAMALNSPPIQKAPGDATKVSTSCPSLFNETSPPGTPRLAESPSPTPSLPNTPSPLDKRLSDSLNHPPLRTRRDDARSDQTSSEILYLARELSLPYEAWETVSTTLGQINRTHIYSVN